MKDGPGGLRDLHILRWFGDAEGLTEAEATLTTLRRKLHAFFGRDSNVLTFDAQDAIGPSPEAVMAGYFRAARTISVAPGRKPDPPLFPCTHHLAGTRAVSDDAAQHSPRSP